MLSERQLESMAGDRSDNGKMVVLEDGWLNLQSQQETKKTQTKEKQIK
jgi:hypothetical protein